MILDAKDSALLAEALEDAKRMRVSLGLGRITMTGGDVDAIDADADAVRAYRRLLKAIEAAIDATGGAATGLEIDTDMARLSADALEDGAAYVGGLMLFLGHLCPCCTRRSLEYQTLRDAIQAALDKGAA